MRALKIDMSKPSHTHIKGSAVSSALNIYRSTAIDIRRLINDSQVLSNLGSQFTPLPTSLLTLVPAIILCKESMQYKCIMMTCHHLSLHVQKEIFQQKLRYKNLPAKDNQ